ncbi:unnamed protein product [Rhizoctonia solani]|uniref:HTH cro/C1-type domain-containing protein n=1 Tax=Rhizoctonia solani TaxID=456999 RepID=A0A8H3E6P6_9AGAM|nr:unnamed protein product [Rhizoctonia solani]CAE7190107.1 unnamed protein product [Rhizoctonia solani]
MSDHACSHLVEAMNKKGWDYQRVASELNVPVEQVEAWFTGKEKPDPVQFNAILGVLKISDEPPHDPAHLPAGK